MQQKPNKFTRKTAHKIRALEGFYCAHAWLGKIKQALTIYKEDIRQRLEDFNPED